MKDNNKVAVEETKLNDWNSLFQDYITPQKINEKIYLSLYLLDKMCFLTQFLIIANVYIALLYARLWLKCFMFDDPFNTKKKTELSALNIIIPLCKWRHRHIENEECAN